MMIQDAHRRLAFGKVRCSIANSNWNPWEPCYNLRSAIWNPRPTTRDIRYTIFKLLVDPHCSTREEWNSCSTGRIKNDKNDTRRSMTPQAVLVFVLLLSDLQVQIKIALLQMEQLNWLAIDRLEKMRFQGWSCRRALLSGIRRDSIIFGRTSSFKLCEIGWLYCDSIASKPTCQFDIKAPEMRSI